ncbi:GNAT family N-acetyltransferase, partial [Actinomyces sp. MRS3W]|uniref:GNAT family N-acetyltransferase n=1 Tax=Actinomyces sp. MRS3W TaxID=2800796 RepID=UPI0028FDBB38
PPVSPSTSAAAGFVREATLADLEAIGRVHATTMLASLEAAYQAAHDAPLPDGVAAMVAAPVVAAGWEQAILAPPSSTHRVLVSVGEGGEVVGLVGVAPSPGDATGGVGPDAAARGLEITALGVAPEQQRCGHGSRLLAAATDQARAHGADVLLIWAVRGDESLTSFLQDAGLTPTDSHRELPVGEGITEDCWAAAL